MMNKYLVFLIIICSFYGAHAQVANIVDSIDFYKFSSSDVFLYGPNDKLYLFIGKPNVVLPKREIPCSYDGDIYFNFYSLWYKRKNLIYWENENKSNLHAIKINKSNYRICYEDFCFDKNTIIFDVINHFEIPLNRVDTVSGNMVPFKTARNSIFFQIIFTYPGICKDEIALYFNRKGYLVDMHFNIYR